MEVMIDVYLAKLVFLTQIKHFFVMLDYPAIAAVAAVIREGTFERGAATLGITPSAISQRVRGLEERLGAILIVRGNPCEPTELGRTLCAHLDRVMLLEHDIAPSLGTINDAGALLTVRVAVNADSLATWFPVAIATFSQQAGLSLDLTVEDETATADKLRGGEVLAAVTAEPEPVQGCKTSSLGALRYAACASPSFVERHFPNGVTGSALRGAPNLRFDRRDMLQQRWAKAAFGIELVGPTHWIPSPHSFVDLAIQGVGWSMQPLAMVEAHIDAGRLIDLVPEVRLDIGLYWTVARLHARPLRNLTDAVRTAAAEHLAQANEDALHPQ